MSGSGIKTTVGMDAIASYLMSKISYFKLGEGGFVLSQEVSEEIVSSASGIEASYTYNISGGNFPIIAIDSGNNEIEITGEYADFFTGGTSVKIENSSNNDGNYTVIPTGATESGGSTFVRLVESLVDDTPDGRVYVDRLPIAIGPSSDSSHFPLVIEEIDGVSSVIQSISDTSGSGTLSGDGSGSVNYKNGAIAFTFDSNVSAGNSVRIRFKYHESRKDPSVGLLYTDLESENSPIAGDGSSELFTYTKNFGVDADTEVVSRGSGYATIRCKMKLQAVEGIDDGRGTTYGGTPYYFEGGIFDEDDIMVAYFTFDKQRKIAPMEITHTFDFVF